MEKKAGQTHFVLVHGASHGAWCWYKLHPMLQAAGHRVTALDLAASGRDMRNLHDLKTLDDYTQPLLELMETLSPGEKVVLVGHSSGGLNLGLAMDKYPEKIAVAVFLAAFMPDSVHGPSYVLDKYNERTTQEDWLDTEFLPYGTAEAPLTSMFFGPRFISEKLYQLSAPEDLALANSLVRISSLFLEDLSSKSAFSDDRFGSVTRTYIVCTEDKGIPEDFQRWMINTVGVTEVMEIKDADHMAMLTKPQELCQCLLQIAEKYK